MKLDLSAYGAAHRGIRFEISSLLFAAFKTVKRHLEKGTPLVMPAEVAVIYVANPELDSSYECEDCGYELPVRRARRAEQEQTIYFALCSLCGSQVSWCGFLVKQSRKKMEGTNEGDGMTAGEI